MKLSVFTKSIACLRIIQFLLQSWFDSQYNSQEVVCIHFDQLSSKSFNQKITKVRWDCL